MFPYFHSSKLVHWASFLSIPRNKTTISVLIRECLKIQNQHLLWSEVQGAYSCDTSLQFFQTTPEFQPNLSISNQPWSMLLLFGLQLDSDRCQALIVFDLVPPLCFCWPDTLMPHHWYSWANLQQHHAPRGSLAKELRETSQGMGELTNFDSWVSVIEEELRGCWDDLYSHFESLYGSSLWSLKGYMIYVPFFIEKFP